jgi:hypothetical protein
MWEFPGTPGDPRFLVIAQALPDLTTPVRERLIVHGELRTPDEAKPAGFALALQAPTREAVDALLGSRQVEIHDWEFGGRR